MNSGSGPDAGTRRWWAAALSLLLAATAAGCLGGEKDSGKASASPSSKAQARIPPGFAQASSDAVSLAYPPGWKPATPPKGWTFLAELAAGGDIEARVGVITSVPQIPNAKLVAESLDTLIQTQLSGVRRGPNQKVDIPGADEAVRIDYSYPNPQAVAGAAAGAPVTNVDIALVIQRRKAAVVRLTGLQSRLTPALVDQILHSIAVKA